MNRNTSIVLFFISVVVFFLICYYGALVTIWSSVALSVFLALIILNIIYPPGQAATDSADVGLAIYIVIEILGLVVLAIYIAQKAIFDIRKNKCGISLCTL